MELKQIFAKPVDRPIEGVIKADDLTSLKLEVEEYVITNEVSKSLTKFLEAYNNYQGANGVWISGFFGSGKSHLLKMLALLLENQAIDGKLALEYFLPKCQEDAFLKGGLNKATAIPSNSILFNIDQKADTISKTETDAVLSVFVKVFNEMRGYYGKQGYVAKFELDLDTRGVYEDFQQAFKEIAGTSWKRGREQIILEKNNVAKAYARVSESSVESQKNIVDAYRDDYKLSIEDFAEQVNAYIQDQEPGFRLNFFVDEVGQYIADNVKLMTNLQTIAESLATKCKGQAWLIVTAQDDMSKVLGKMGKQQTTDFSKIQARFKTRVKLTSQNVDEVIEKRLLNKNDQGKQVARKLYRAEENNFGTLFDFADGATTYRNYRDEAHFVDAYPFVPYQFTLFQSSIETLSAHEAFEGKHQSVGERSMLEVFQEVVKRIAEEEVGELATYDLMFEGLQATLKAQTQGAIWKADKHLSNDFAKRILRALFLVKYVEGFNATPRNLRVLMQSRFDQDLPALQEKMKQALTLLESQTYIQRSGNEYEYLTDEEKDIEQEIKNTEVDSGDVNDTLEEIVFSDIIRDRKIRYDVTGQDYSFTKKVDDRIIGRRQELAIHLVTPFHENIDAPDILRANSLGKPELMVVLPADVRLMEDLLLYKKTDKYVRLNRTSAQRESIQEIIYRKGSQNNQRFKEIKNRARSLMAQAKLYVSGEKIKVAAKDPKSRVIKGFNELVVKTYPNLRMLRAVSYEEEDIRKYLELTKGSMFDGESTDLTEPEQEVLAHLKSNQRVGVLTTVKSLVETFTQKPYGWYLAAIQCQVAMLHGRGKIEARSDANILDGDNLERALKNTHGFSNVILEPRTEYTSSQLRRLKDFYNDFFDQPPVAQAARALGKETKDALRVLLGELRELHAQREQYPFLAVLEEPIQTVESVIPQNYTYFLEELPSQEEALLDMKEDILDPVRRFMRGNNKGIYDRVRHFVQEQGPNFSDVKGDAPQRLQAILQDPACYTGDKMRTAKTLFEDLKAHIETLVEEERQRAVQAVQRLKESIQAIDEYAQLASNQIEQLERSFQRVQDQIQLEHLIAVMRDRVRRFESDDYIRLLEKIDRWTQSEEKDNQGVAEPRPIYIARDELPVPFARPYLATEADVEAYLEKFKEVMLKTLRDGKRIQV